MRVRLNPIPLFVFVLLTGCTTWRVPEQFTWPVSHDDFAHAAVAADHPAASAAGVEILRSGGNAVDAAVATSFALSVVRPESCGIGGGGFMVIYDPGGEGESSRSVAINYREQCPDKVGPRYYVKLNSKRAGFQGTADFQGTAGFQPAGSEVIVRSLASADSGQPRSQPNGIALEPGSHPVRTSAGWKPAVPIIADKISSTYGYHASGIPGTVAGLLYALETYGTLDRDTVLAPAIRAAEEGFIADETYVESRLEAMRLVESMPGRGLGPLWDDGSAAGIPEVGEIVRNPDQARALRLIAEHGAAAFYRGEIADSIVNAMRENGGTITRDDLANYQIDSSQPLRRRFRDWEILAMPPPSSGGVALLQMFGMLEERLYEVRIFPQNSAASIHFLTETMKHAFADRAEWLADPAYVDVPVDRLLSDAYIERLAWSISLTRTMNPKSYGSRRPPPAEDGGTSHFSVIDSNGMAVACTETINTGYGSLVVVPGFGFCLNNQMDDFTTRPGEPNVYGLVQSDRNSPQPGKRPLSSMSPTIVLRGGRAVLVAGASGGPRIITSTYQCLLNCMFFEMTAGESVASPRFHHQWVPDRLLIESNWDAGDLPDALRPFGHEIERSDSVGAVQLIHVRNGIIHAACDPRKGGRPDGF